MTIRSMGCCTARSPCALAPALLLALLAAACAPAPPGADMVVRNGRVVTGSGDVLDPGTIVIVGGRIARVVAGDDATVGREEVDAAGRTVMPGLIDSHVHLLFRAKTDSDEAFATFSREKLPDILEDALRRGVTTVVSNGDFWPEIREVRDRIRAGELAGPRVLTTGPILTAAGGHPAVTFCAGNPWCRAHLTREVAGAEAAREQVRVLAGENVDAIKVVYDSLGGTERISPETLAAIVEEAHGLGLPVLAHGPVESEGLLELVSSGIDVLSHPPALCDSGMDDLIAALLTRKIPVATTLGIFAPVEGPAGRSISIYGEPYPEGWSALLEGSERCLLALFRAGVPLILGTDAPFLESGGAVLRESGLLLDAGLSAADVIDLATRVPGATHPLLGDAGLIEPGRRADLLIVDGDPYEDLGALARLKVVLIEGRVVLDRRPR